MLTQEELNTAKFVLELVKYFGLSSVEELETLSDDIVLEYSNEVDKIKAKHQAKEVKPQITEEIKKK